MRTEVLFDEHPLQGDRVQRRRSGSGSLGEPGDAILAEVLEAAGPADRILILGVPDTADLFALAAKLTRGLIVVIAPEDRLQEGRKLARDYDNVMFTRSDPGEPISWRDDLFTIVVAPDHEKETPEIVRVLAPGGTAMLAGGVYSKPRL